MVRIGSCIRKLKTDEGEVTVYSLRELEKQGIIKDLGKMPYSIKVIVESMLRNRDGGVITDDDVRAIASWSPETANDHDIPWMPARVLLQDLTGGAAVTDLASMREAVSTMGRDP
ncbi:MAG: aconitate hydratase, partial [Candidatus Methanoplasma sp.]|nr:aconitate hydratase [Candidatus Methanoplasma sp.]